MINPTVTVNPTASEPYKCEDVQLIQVLKHFKNKDAHGIEEIRAEEDEEKQNKMKGELPVVIFGGSFEHRSKNKLRQASGLASLDFDCYTKAESEKIKAMLENDKYIFSFFRSTRGLGWKALVRIPVVESDEEYKKYWYALENRFGETDSACKDISRACYYTYDPDLYINEDAEIFNKTNTTDLKEANKNIDKLSSENNKTDYNLINKAANIIRSASKGERHTMILKASHLAGGWVGSGRVAYEEAERILLNEANKCNPEDPDENKNTVVDGLQKGKDSPLSKQEQEALLNEQRIKNKFDKIYWTIEEREDEIWEAYENGRPEGYYTGYKNIDELYSMHLGYTTYIYGPPFSGKSQLWFDFLKNFSYRYDMKHVIFSPETGEPKDVFVKLVEMVAHQDFYDDYDNQMSKDQLKDAMEFVKEHFIIIDPQLKSMNIDDIIGTCQIIERVYDTKLHTITIDPFNDINRNLGDYGGRQDLYLEDALRKFRVHAKINDWHICVITHTRDQDKKKINGQECYPPASFRDVAGGQVWSRRGFMMSSIWRPPQSMDSFGDIELEGNEVFFMQQKYKPEWTGERGSTHLRYDAKNHCYYRGTGALKKYANLNGEEQAQQVYSQKAPF